jgi:hypothetical protein
VTLHDLWQLANQWCPKKASWDHLLEAQSSWGPAHELGHALIEPPSGWHKHDYGRCALAFCIHRGHRCYTYEVAAMLISHRLLRAAGYEHLADREYNETSDIDLVDGVHTERAKALLRRKKLWPVPRTLPSLERALQRRLGKPRGRKQPRVQKIRGSVGLSMFQNMLFNPGAL